MLELKNISLTVTDPEHSCRKEILRDINLTIEENSFVVITGPNGGGKSTLAKVIMGIETPSSGKIYLDGEDITHLDVSERARRGIGFAFQQPVRFKGLSVKDLLCLASGKELSTEEACLYLSEVGMCANDYVGRELNGTLSGGELKRIEIAMLLARGTRLSIFDEPEAGIDLWSFQNLIRVFHNIRNLSRGGSAIIISHQERILDVADTLVVMKQGEITGIGPKETVLPGLIGGHGHCEIIARGI